MGNQIFAGAGLGLLVGLLVGLSSSPVVSAVVGAIATALVTLLGLQKTAKAEAGTAEARGAVARVGAFGFCCAIALIVGLLLRTHNWLSPSIAEQVHNVQSAGYTEQEARQWVAYKNIGAPFTDAAPAERAKDVDRSITSVLFAGGAAGDCQYFDPSQYKDRREQLAALQQKEGAYADYAKKIAALDDGDQKKVLDALHILYCPH